MHILTAKGWRRLVRSTVNHNQPKDKTLLEELGLTPTSIADQYHNAVQDYVTGKNPDSKRLAMLLGARNVI